MAYPEPSMTDHLAPWNEDYDEETGERFCTCTRCNAARKKAAREEVMCDDYDFRREND
jgi:hypothetical protein